MNLLSLQPSNPAHAADWRLAQRARAQQPAAWMELVRATQGIVMGLLVRHVPAQDREDLFQEIFMRVHRFLGSYRGDSALSTWIYQVTMNIIRTHWEVVQRRKSREVLATDWQSVGEDGQESTWDIPVQPNQELDLDDVERRAKVRAIQGAIGAMKPMDRQILLLRDVDGCSYEEISLRLQVPAGTVKSRLARARANLAEALTNLSYRSPSEGPGRGSGHPCD
jgi:RNA polymerase sigma-70 factor (ECF subfamily)